MNIYLQGSRKCRAKVITNIINGFTSIVKVKGGHNHAVNINRRKPTKKSFAPDDNDGQIDDNFDYLEDEEVIGLEENISFMNNSDMH